MRALAILALLVTQQPAIDLGREYALTRSGSAQAMVTLIAVHPDGTPVRGFISCAGHWQKFQDGESVYVEGLPFRTDARGSVVFNPYIADEWISCTASDGKKSGRVVVEFNSGNPSQVVEIVLR